MAFESFEERYARQQKEREEQLQQKYMSSLHIFNTKNIKKQKMRIIHSL